MCIRDRLYGANQAGPNGIIPFHITLINTSQVDAENLVVDFSLPNGFSFNSDTLLFTGNSTFSDIIRPIEDAPNAISWSDFDIPSGDSVLISFSVFAEPSIAEELYLFTLSSQGVITKPYIIEHSLQIHESLYYSPEAYSCEPAFYQVYQKKNAPNIFGKLIVKTGEYEELGIIDAQLNGLGFDQLSGYTYGSLGSKFIRMDESGNASYMNIDFEKKVYVGDMDDIGNWYGKDNGDIVKINVESNTIINRFENQGMPGWDMAYNKDGNFYAVHNNDVYIFDTNINQSSYLGSINNNTLPNLSLIHI